MLLHDLAAYDSIYQLHHDVTAVLFSLLNFNLNPVLSTFR